MRLMDRLGAGVVGEAAAKTAGVATAEVEALGVGDPGIPRAALAEVGWAVQAVRHGERVAAAEGRRLAAGEREGQGPRMRP